MRKVMVSDYTISRGLVKKNAYTDLPNPVILFSGQLAIFYINTEKLADMPGAPIKEVLDRFKAAGEKDSAIVINEAVRRSRTDSDFRDVINLLTDRVEQYMDQENVKYVISGGETRDWVFSGPVASRLGLSHFSVYKNGRVEGLDAAGEREVGLLAATAYTNRLRAIHVPDLLTEASSCYRLEYGQQKGWIPEIRARSVEVKDLVAVVSRLQGGERNLAHQGVYADSLVQIDADFLRQHSTQPDVAIAYIQDPNAWSEEYLMENGALALVPAFSPESMKKDNRAKKFWDRYGDAIKEAGKYKELDKAVRKKYAKGLVSLLTEK